MIVLDKLSIVITTRPTTKKERMYKGRECALPRFDEVRITGDRVSPTDSMGFIDDGEDPNGVGVRMYRLRAAALKLLAEHWGIGIAVRRLR